MFYVNYELIENAKENRLNQRETVHIQATRTFETRIECYASVVSGLRSYMLNKEEFPSAPEMQDFLDSHIKDLNFEDSVIISYLDAKHTFIYSISNYYNDQSPEPGTNVGDYVPDSALRSLEKVFEDENLHLYKPINLSEGWVGLSFNFSIRQQSEVVGYVTAILNFNNIIQELYTPQVIEDFCFQFTSEGRDFDRERVHTNSNLTNDRHDPEYYKNFNLDSLSFLYSDIELYNRKFRIGTSYKTPFSANLLVPVSSGIWYIIFAAMVIYILR